MKFLTPLLLLCVLFACNEANETFETASKEISLVSPNGINIAATKADLQKEIESTIWKKIGKEEAFEIIEINYLESRTETLALIEFKSVSGITSNIGYSFALGDESRGPIKFTVSCDGDCGCRVGGSIGSDGTVSFSCACDDCILSIEGN